MPIPIGEQKKLLMDQILCYAHLLAVPTFTLVKVYWSLNHTGTVGLLVICSDDNIKRYGSLEVGWK